MFYSMFKMHVQQYKMHIHTKTWIDMRFITDQDIIKCYNKNETSIKLEKG